MKYNLITILLFLVATKGYSQGKTILSIFPVKDNKICYEKVIVADSLSKSELYNRIKLWGLRTFNNAKEVTQIDDRENGILAFTGYFNKVLEGAKVSGAKITDNRQVWSTTLFLIKDGRVKITIESIKLKSEVYARNALATASGGSATFWFIEDFDRLYNNGPKRNKSIIEANRQYFQELNDFFQQNLERISTDIARTNANENDF